jgi:hypothetical protein
MNERISKIINSPLRVPVGVGLVGLGVGVGIGYILGKRKATYYILPKSEQLEMDFSPEPQVWEPIEKEHHETPVTAPEFKEKVNTFIADKLKNDILTKNEEEPGDDVEARSVFAHTDDEWDYEKEVTTRTQTEPYVLHKDEFYADELSYAQSTLTYYAGDDILVDEDDTPIYDRSVTGDLNFGHGSGDPNVVYIRNNKRKAEYEVIKDPGLYSVEVLGLEIENNERVRDIKHSSNRRFRME